MGCHFLLQAIFLTQGSNLGLLHCKQILYCLSHQGSPVRAGRESETREEQSRAALRQGPISPSMDIHTTISLSCFADTETPSRWEKLMINDGMLPTSLETPDQLNLKVDDVDSCLPHQPTPLRRISMS